MHPVGYFGCYLIRYDLFKLPVQKLPAQNIAVNRQKIRA